jgi:hypothetical protein
LKIPVKQVLRHGKAVLRIRRETKLFLMLKPQPLSIHAGAMQPENELFKLAGTVAFEQENRLNNRKLYNVNINNLNNIKKAA